MAKVKKVSKIKQIAVKLAALSISAAAFAVWHTGEAEAIRSAPEAYFASSRGELSELLTKSASGITAVEASGSYDERLGKTYTELKLFGFIPVKRVPAFIGERARVVPGGEAVGIGIYTEGVLIVGLGDAEEGQSSPAAQAGLKAGDVILEVNGTRTDTAAELTEALRSAGESARLTVVRGTKQRTVAVRLDDNGETRLGAWVRDSTVGIGTLSFADTENYRVAALGHSVSDRDTGSNIRVKDGALRLAEIVGVVKGSEGAPGELRGTFGGDSPLIGSIEQNTELGIFGSLSETALAFFTSPAIPVAFPDEVKTGEAEIVCSCEGEPKSYKCRIIKAGRQSHPAQKGMVIEITDERLLALTGGIVQGMSGSPVIQNGMLVGAVTHVFVNDPTRGYGAYAYWIEKACGGSR